MISLLIAIIRTLFLKKKKASYEFSTDKKRSLEYANKLSKLIQYETISIRDTNQVDKFRGFHKVIESQFPNVFKHLEKIEIDGNLLMKWKGKNPKLDPIILISHQDVVEGTGKWEYPPFSGKIVKDRIYGRGTLDIKSGILCFYQAVEELLIDGYTPNCDVYLGSSCTEEIGGDGAPKLVKYFKDNNIHLFMLSDEGGAIIEDPMKGIKGAFASIGVFEKGIGDIKFTAKGNGGHASAPNKNTPIARLAAFENELETKKIFKSKCSKEFIAMLNNLAPYADKFSTRLLFHNTWLFKPLIKFVLSKSSGQAAAMLRTTICFTMQQGSQGYNVIPQEAYVGANLRYIPHQGKDESNKMLNDLASKYNIEMEFIKGNDFSKALDLNGEPYKMTINAIKKVFPTVGIMPYIVTGATDARFFDSVCDNCVRFTPLLFSKDQIKGIHGLNENLFISTLPKGVDYFKELIRLQESRK